MLHFVAVARLHALNYAVYAAVRNVRFAVFMA